MGAVHIGVGHDDDAVVAKLVGVEVVPPDAAAERRDQCANLGGSQHLVETRFLDVQDLALERQYRLAAPVAALLGRAAGRIALDKEQLGLGRVFFLAVRQLARQSGNVERALAPGHLAGLACRLAGAGRIDDLGHDGLGFLRLFEKVFLEPGRHGLFHDALDFR